MVESGCKGCFVNAHGPLSIAGMFMSLVAWALSFSVHATCFFVRANNSEKTGYGMWMKESVIDNECFEYTVEEHNSFDTKWNATAGLAYSAGITGFIFTVLMFGTMCSVYRQAFFKLAAANYVVAGILDLCTLVGLNSNICETLSFGNATQCEFSTGAGLAVGAGVCYFITAAIVFFIPPAKEEMSKPPADIASPPEAEDLSKMEEQPGAGSAVSADKSKEN